MPGWRRTGQTEARHDDRPDPAAANARRDHDRRADRGRRHATAVVSRRGDTDAAPVWVCPRCGARLVSRNLWHSCGRWTLEALFQGAQPGVLECARGYVELLESLGDVQIIAQKTRLVCVARVRFAGLYPRKRSFLATFALRRWLDSPRIIRTEDYGPRWRMHVVRVRSQADLDDQLRAWLQEAHDTVGLQREL